MGTLKLVEAPDAPRAIGPYAHAVECRPSRMLFLSGQIPVDPATGMLVDGDIKAQARQVLANLDAVLIAGGMSRFSVVKTTVYLVDLGEFGDLNEVYAEYFGDHRPARATVQVAALPKGARVEMDATAVD